LPINRQELLSELERLIHALREERIAPWEAEDRLFYLFGRAGFRWHVEEIHEQLHQLRSEVAGLRNEPVRCAYTEDRGQVIHMLTGMPGETERDLKYIKKKSHSNEWLIITDPYFLQWGGPNKAFASEKIYTEYIIDYIPRDLKKLDLFILPDPNKRIKKKFNDRIRGRGTLISYWETTEIHDRTIIRDNMTGTMMGTSFGGLGNKLAFILDIPTKDLENFMRELDRIRGFA
jgi:hypothetical protein